MWCDIMYFSNLRGSVYITALVKSVVVRNGYHLNVVNILDWLRVSRRSLCLYKEDGGSRTQPFLRLDA